MAHVLKVDYEAMPAQAGEMRSYGKQLNTEISKAYSDIEQMHESWYGDRYNDLVKSFNNMIPSINSMLKLVVTEVPYTLEVIANNYSQADTGSNVVAANNEAHNTITDVPVISDVGMRFITSDVQTIQQDITTLFRNSKDLMDKIESVYGKIQWESEAADAFKTTFTKLKNEVVSSFENINSQFTTLMEQTKQDIENAEKANTVNT